MALIGTAINDSAAPTYINLIFVLLLMGDMPTNKARTSDNAQQQSASNDVPILFLSDSSISFPSSNLLNSSSGGSIFFSFSGITLYVATPIGWV